MSYLQEESLGYHRQAYADSDARAQLTLPEKLENNYETLGKLGFGTYGAVFKVQHKVTGKVSAMKKIKRPRRHSKKCDEEVEILRGVNHSKIVKLHEYFNEGGHLFIFMEVCDNETLGKKMEIMNGETFLESVIWRTLTQIIDGLLYLHKYPIIHRDLKPDNILFHGPEGNLKIADFGISKILAHEDDQTRTRTGTPTYMAPELCARKEYGVKVDIWSLGVIVFKMATTKYPFEFRKNAEAEEVSNVICGEVPRLLHTVARPGEYTNYLLDLSDDLLKKDPIHRMNSADVVIRIDSTHEQVAKCLYQDDEGYSPGDSSDPENEFGQQEASSYHEKTLTNGYEANEQIPEGNGEVTDQKTYLGQPVNGSQIDRTLTPKNESLDLNLNGSYNVHASRGSSLPPTVEMPTAESRKSRQESYMDTSDTLDFF